MKTAPVSGAIRQPSRDRRVVLPLPDGPMTSVKVDAENLNDTSVSAGMRVLPDPNETLAFSTAREYSGSSTEHLGGLHRNGGLYRQNGSENAHCQSRQKNANWQPPGCGDPGNVRPGDANHRVSDQDAQ